MNCIIVVKLLYKLWNFYWTGSFCSFCEHLRMINISIGFQLVHNYGFDVKHKVVVKTTIAIIKKLENQRIRS